jgi:hypothetical protein
MRIAFGLVGILVTLGVIIMIMSFIELPAIKQARQTQKKTEQTLGALTSSGIQDSKDSIVLDPLTKGSRFDSLIVRSIVPGGAMQVNYGLMTNDVIIGVNGMTFDTVANGDSELAESLIWEARGKQQKLMVVRNGRKLDLPWLPPPETPPGGGAGGGGTNAGANAGETGAGAGSEEAKPRESPLSRQVRIQTH